MDSLKVVIKNAYSNQNELVSSQRESMIERPETLCVCAALE